MDYQKASQVQNLLTEAYIARPHQLVLSFGLQETEKVDELASDHRTIIGVSLIPNDGERYTIRLFTTQPEPIFNRQTLGEQLGVSTEDIEVIVTEGIFAFNEPIQTLVRPAPLGCSVGHFSGGAGTFGALVKDNERTYILSNNHVLAAENQATLNDPIVQPGQFDGGSVPSDVIAHLARFVPIDFFGVNKIDAAIATVDNLSNVINAFPSSDPFIGSIRGVTNPVKGMTVAKYGRTTGLTVGRIESLNSGVTVIYGSGSAPFTEQLEIVGTNGPFSQRGDSGSVIVDLQSKRAVGLLFAGLENGRTFANPISNVLQTLNVTFV